MVPLVQFQMTQDYHGPSVGPLRQGLSLDAETPPKG
jgi:hypothetical protein